MRSKFPASAKKSKTRSIGKPRVNLRVKICSAIESEKVKRLKSKPMKIEFE